MNATSIEIGRAACKKCGHHPIMHISSQEILTGEKQPCGGGPRGGPACECMAYEPSAGDEAAVRVVVSDKEACPWCGKALTREVGSFRVITSEHDFCSMSCADQWEMQRCALTGAPSRSRRCPTCGTFLREDGTTAVLGLLHACTSTRMVRPFR